MSHCRGRVQLTALARRLTDQLCHVLRCNRFPFTHATLASQLLEHEEVVLTMLTGVRQEADAKPDDKIQERTLPSGLFVGTV